MLFDWVISDIDNTLVADGAISERDAQAVRSLEPAGVRFALATGRPPKSARQWAARTGAGHFVAANGAAVFATAQDRALWVHEGLTRPAAASCLIAAEEAGARVTIDDLHQRYVLAGDTSDPAIRELVAMHDVQVSPESWPPNGTPIVKLQIVADHTTLRRVREALPLGLAVTLNHDPAILEVAPPGVSKATGVGKLLALCGSTWARTLAIGDAENDCTMCASAGWSVAVDGGRGSERLREVVTYTTDLGARDGAVSTALAALLRDDPAAMAHLSPARDAVSGAGR